VRRSTIIRGGGDENPKRKGIPEFPAWKAFVVQFSREASAQTGNFSGRVEHLSSGRRGRFSSTQELVDILEKLLDELGAASDEGNPRD
jgi:hypothetical protein